MEGHNGDISQAFDRMKHDARDLVMTAGAVARKSMRDAQDSIHHAKERASETAGGYYTNFRQHVVTRPVTDTITALGIGFLAGWLMHGCRKEKEQ